MDRRDDTLVEPEPPLPQELGGLSDLEIIRSVLDRRGIRYSAVTDYGNYTLVLDSMEDPHGFIREPALRFTIVGTLERVMIW